MFNFIEIEENEEIGDFFDIEVIPTVLMISSMKEVQKRLDNPDITELSSKIESELDIFKENFQVKRERIFPRLK